MDKIKSCPFCGGVGELEEMAFGGYVISCRECGASIQTNRIHYSRGFDPKENVIKKWNKRNNFWNSYKRRVAILTFQKELKDL